MGTRLREMLNMHGDTASYEEIHSRIIDGGQVRGTNLCILILAIFIASIGLNMNSTAVVIGAMLISPLMGGIMAIAYGIATADMKQARISAVGLLVQVIACLIISSLYFKLSPIKSPSSEILARTKPTIWDVMIACFGGFAGIIGITRKEKSNVIPGVAIATALMPPLCTAGYGIARGSLKYFAGAIYLFLLNSYFICLASLIVLLVLDVPKRSNKVIPAQKLKRMKFKIIRNSIILIIPSLFFGAQLVMNEVDSAAYTTSKIIDDTSEKTEQLKSFYPEIEEMEIWHDYGVTTEIKVILFTNGSISEEDRLKINRWIEKEYDSANVIYVDLKQNDSADE